MYAALVEYVSCIALHLYNLVVFLEILEAYRALFDLDLRLAVPEYLAIECLDYLLVPFVRCGLLVCVGRPLSKHKDAEAAPDAQPASHDKEVYVANAQ